MPELRVLTPAAGAMKPTGVATLLAESLRGTVAQGNAFVAVAIGASWAFLTPIGQQNNTRILGSVRVRRLLEACLPLETMIIGLSVRLLLVV